jgi:hypothetical protein
VIDADFTRSALVTVGGTSTDTQSVQREEVAGLEVAWRGLAIRDVGLHGQR